MAALNQTDEKELVLLLSAGDRKAFEQIYHQYKHQIYSKLLKLLRSEEFAEELLQEVFYKLWVNREHLDKVQSFPAYLYRMAANLVADFYRKAAMNKKLQNELIYSAVELYDHVEELINYKESHALVQQAIAALPKQRQQVFTLCKVEGKSYSEVSKILGISTSTINDHIVKASKTIKQHLINSNEVALIAVIAIMLSHS